MNAENAEQPTEQTGWDEETSRIFIDYGRYFVPERDRQMRTIAALLSHLEGPCIVLELCCGEGLLAEVLLGSFATFSVHGLDGSVEMLQRARERLARFENRFRSRVFNLASADWRKPGFPVHAVVSSMAIHHLTGPQKQALFSDVYRMLVEGGAFVIADIVEHPGQEGQRVAAEAWDEEVRKRSMELDGNTGAFEFFEREGWNTFWYLDAEDIDKPSPLYDQLKWLEGAGFVEVDVHWMLAGHAVFSGRKRQNGKKESGATQQMV
ncbi:MAG: class I SAM-dependent methyltransferase [Chloroflexota bacterium]